MSKKICTHCKVEKDLELFSKSKVVKSGRTAKCKECMAEIMRKYAANNRETIRANNLKSYRKHKVKRKQGEKKSYLDNREKRLKSRKEYYIKNKEEIITRVNKYYHSLKDGLFYVYLLPEEHYCGQTDSIVLRERGHRQHGKLTDNMDVVMSFNTREEAKQLEKAFHKLGWYGENELHSGNYKYG